MVVNKQSILFQATYCALTSGWQLDERVLGLNMQTSLTRGHGQAHCCCVGAVNAIWG